MTITLTAPTSRTSITNNHPPASPGCGLKEASDCRVKSETPQFAAMTALLAPWFFSPHHHHKPPVTTIKTTAPCQTIELMSLDTVTKLDPAQTICLTGIHRSTVTNLV